MKIILVNSPSIDIYGPIKISAGRYFPLGIGYLAAVIKKDGHEVLFLDPEVQGLNADGIKELLFRAKPDIVGISCATPNFKQALKIASFSKTCSSAMVILGGVHASAVPEWILKSKNVDIKRKFLQGLFDSELSKISKFKNKNSYQHKFINLINNNKYQKKIPLVKISNYRRK